MNLKDLSKIDIKDFQNIDWGAAKDQLFSRTDLIINIVMVIITITIFFGSYNKFTSVKNTIKTEEASLHNKLEALNKLKTIQKEHGDFIEILPKSISADQLIRVLSEFATRHDVQIVSFSPATKKSNRLIDLTSVEVDVSSENYEKIILFVNDVENSPHAIRVTKLSGSLTQPPRAARSARRGYAQEDLNETEARKAIQARITIETIEFKNVR